MPMKRDRLTEELRRFDPVEPGTLEQAAESDAAADLLARILAEDPTEGGETSRSGEHAGEFPRDAGRTWWRPTPAKLALVEASKA